MKKGLKIIAIILSFLPIIVSAKECDWAEISNKKTLARNISWSYEYYIVKNKMYFDITVSNVYDDLYVIDLRTGKKYTKKEFVIEKLSDNQKLQFEIYSQECKEQVATKDIALPTYNKYYGTSYCEGISEFSSCKKWQTLSSSITEEVLKEQTNEYRESIANPKVEVIEYGNQESNFYIFIGLILFSLILLLIFTIRGKREKNFV